MQPEPSEEEARDEYLAAAISDTEPKEKDLEKGAKNFTGKILSFIKKLGRTEEQPEEEEHIQDEFEDFDDIEQVSDFDQSSADLEDDTDVYSIISTPKPKFQPFFTNSNPDLSRLDTANNSSDLQCLSGAISFKSLRKNRSTGSMELPKGNVVNALERHIEESFAQPQRPPICLFVVRSTDPLIHAACLHSISSERALFVDLLELGAVFELCLKIELNLKMKKAESPLVVKMILVGDDSFFSQYLQSYVENLRGDNAMISFLRHYFIPRQSSILGKELTEFGSAFNSLFGDTFWNTLDDEAGKRDLVEVWSRIRTYIDSPDTKNHCLQIGEVLVNSQLSSLLMPFICSIKVFCKESPDEGDRLIAPINRVSLSSSKSVPQFVQLAACGLKPGTKSG